MRLVAYTRVSTREQGVSGLGMEAQRAAIEAYAAMHPDVEIGRWESDVVSTREDERPGQQAARLWMVNPAYDGIIVSKMDRWARSNLETAQTLHDATKEGWTFICLSPMVDMTTAMGRAFAGFAGLMAELERDLISERTRDALAAKAARGERIGPYIRVDRKADRLVRMMRANGVSYARMAERLNREGIPTTKGRPWSRGTIQRIVERQKRLEAINMEMDDSYYEMDKETA